MCVYWCREHVKPKSWELRAISLMNEFILGESSCAAHTNTHAHTHIRPDNDATHNFERFCQMREDVYGDFVFN